MHPGISITEDQHFATSGSPGIPVVREYRDLVGMGVEKEMGWETGVVEHWQRLQHRKTP